MFWRLISITTTDFALPLLTGFLASEEALVHFGLLRTNFVLLLVGNTSHAKGRLWVHLTSYKGIFIQWLMFLIFSGPSCIFLMGYRCHEFPLTPLSDPNNDSSNERSARQQGKFLRFLIFVPYTRTHIYAWKDLWALTLLGCISSENILSYVYILTIIVQYLEIK